MWVSKRARPTPIYVLAWFGPDVSVLNPKTGRRYRMSRDTFYRQYRPSVDYVAARRYVNR